MCPGLAALLPIGQERKQFADGTERFCSFFRWCILPPHSPTSWWQWWSFEVWPSVGPRKVLTITSILILTDSRIPRFVPKTKLQFSSETNIQFRMLKSVEKQLHDTYFPAGVEWCSHTDLLFTQYLFRGSYLNGQLQQIQKQRIQVQNQLLGQRSLEEQEKQNSSIADSTIEVSLSFSLHRDSILIPIINCVTSFYAGFAIFSVLGFMAEAKNVNVEDVAASGECDSAFCIACGGKLCNCFGFVQTTFRI